MTVNELMQMLEDCDPESEIRIMCQPNWPFEVSISGVAVRESFRSRECDCDHRLTEPHEEGCPAEVEPDYEDGCGPNDVFILEGQQERYGSKRAWDRC